ncbi:hypothetical protein HAX54_043611 [Datura stramonium]|uniref:Uncharacterized protein n=1 Tax=Datura stramonium TaxID=4076 RepID=A0ABS8SNV8_DATST|nr:hypothetical protein [Datura stramonium]
MERETDHPRLNEVEVGTTTHIAPEKGSAKKKKNLDHELIPGDNLNENTIMVPTAFFPAAKGRSGLWSSPRKPEYRTMNEERHERKEYCLVIVRPQFLTTIQTQIHCDILQLNWNLWGLPISPERRKSQRKKRSEISANNQVTSTASGDEGYQQGGVRLKTHIKRRMVWMERCGAMAEEHY